MAYMKRKLAALQHPSFATVNIQDDSSFRQLVAWLEDFHIRYDKPENRARLKAFSSSQWADNFNTYLGELDCPRKYDNTNNEFMANWLLTLAIRLEYSDKVNSLKNMTKSSTLANTERGNLTQAIPVLKNLEPSSEEFKTMLQSCCQQCSISQHPDPLVQLRALALFCKQRLSDAAQNEFNNNRDAGVNLAMKETDLGFKVTDPLLEDPARILRLCHIAELRKLQTDINEIIVLAQSVTANPKTDQSLGKVGY